ncbi:hypothetical protein ACKS0A_10545 [Histoplasma ohiense]
MPSKSACSIETMPASVKSCSGQLYMSWRFTKQLIPCDLIFSTFARIFSRSAFSNSANFPVESTLTRAPKILILSVSIAVFATKIFAFSSRLGWFTPIFLSKMNPSSR